MAFRFNPKSKYNAKRQIIDGINFPSQAEAEYYCVLKLMQEQKMIKDLEVHPKFNLIVQGKLICTFRPDFRFTELTPLFQQVVVDVKGMMTPDALLKLKLLAALNPHLKVDIVKRSGKYFTREALEKC